MSIHDDELLKRLQATFKVEADERIQAISSMLLDLEKVTDSNFPISTLEDIYREAHSLKGAARAVDQTDVEAICQALESVLSGWRREPSRVSPVVFDTIHRSLDAIKASLTPSDESHREKERRQRDESIANLRRVELGQLPVSRRAIEAPQIVMPESAPAQPAPISPENDLHKASMAQTVRMSVAKLDAQLLQAEEMLVAKSALAQRARELQELAASFDQWRKAWTRVSREARVLPRQIQQSRNTTPERPVGSSVALSEFLEWNGDFLRSLERKIVSVWERAEQDRRSVGKQVDELLEESKKLLMLPFSDLGAILPKLVRDLARDQGKEIDFTVQGGEVEIDKRILEEMKDPLIHILRNCVDHGVEKPTERAKLGKAARAAIVVTASRVNGSKVEIKVSDDGAGVDVAGVKASAVRHGVLSENAARALSEAEAHALIFRSDVSTSPIVTEISGRGLGMTIVRAKTEKLGGTVTIESQRQVGTTLRMLLPLKLATFRGILISSAGRVFALPTMHVERVLRVKQGEVLTVENRETISLEGQAVALARLDQVLELPTPSVRNDDSTLLSVVVVRAEDIRIAFAVDDVLHEEEVLVKPLPRPLVRVRNIAGATVLGTGKAVPVLHVLDLMKSARKFANSPRAGGVAVKAEAAKRVLIVEDSITSRMLLKGILESAGYNVKTAVDGMEAFAVLREGAFDLVITDVEMPRLNGFDLTARIRADSRLEDLPVVLVTALESREQRERGIDAGANAYVIKSSFDQGNLLEIIRRLIRS